MKIEDKIQEALDYICIDQVGNGEFIEPSLSGVWRAKKEILALIGEWGKEMVGKDEKQPRKVEHHGYMKFEIRNYFRQEIRNGMAESLGQKKEGE